MTKHQDPERPALHLLDARDEVTFEGIVALFRALTGRDATPQELEDLKKEMDSSDPSN